MRVRAHLVLAQIHDISRRHRSSRRTNTSFVFCRLFYGVVVVHHEENKRCTTNLSQTILRILPEWLYLLDIERQRNSFRKQISVMNFVRFRFGLTPTSSFAAANGDGNHAWPWLLILAEAFRIFYSLAFFPSQYCFSRLPLAKPKSPAYLGIASLLCNPRVNSSPRIPCTVPLNTKYSSI